MTTFPPQERPSDADFDQMISAAQHQIHEAMTVKPLPGHQRRTRHKIVSAWIVAFAVVGGGAAVANVGPFAPTGSGNYSKVQGPTSVDDEPAAGPGENATTTTPWPKNEFGLTFGEPTPTDVLAHNLPDLMPVVTENGEAGFWRSDEVYVYTSDGDVESMPEHPNVFGPDGKTLVDEK